MVPSLRQRGLQAVEALAWGGLWVDRGLTGQRKASGPVRSRSGSTSSRLFGRAR